mgnify:CR=1 FL=1
MRFMLAFAATSAALIVLSAIAIALMISIAGDRTNWWLLGAFIADSALLVLLAARSTLRRGNGSTGRGGAVPR